MSRIGGLGNVIETDRTPAANGNTPREGEVTTRQRPGGSPFGYGTRGGFTSPVIGGAGLDGATVPTTLAAQGTASDGYAAQIFAQLLGPTYATYRLMRTQPTLALGRAIATAPIISSQWAAEATREGVPDAWVNAVKNHVVPLRRPVMTEGLRALDFGNYKFENVWSYARADGLWTIARLKPLAVDANAIVVDRFGNFYGIRPRGGRPSGEDDLNRQKSWVYTHDGEAGDLGGRSRLENVRETAWADWLRTLWKLDKLRDKLCGIIPIFYHPPGSFEEPEGSGNFVTYQQAAADAARALMRGDFATVTHMGGINADDLRNNPDLIKFGLIHIDFYDAGNVAPAQEGMLKNLEYDDRLLLRGYLEPERSVTEARNSGGRADAETHTDTATEIKELLADDFDEQFSAGPVSEFLAVNFGEDARGAVRVKTAPLVNRKAIVNERIIQSLIKAGLAESFARSLDVGQMLETMDVPTLAAFVVKMQEKPKPGGEPGTGGAGEDDKPGDDDDTGAAGAD